MIYKQHKNGSYNIHTIKTDKFKNIRMEIQFRNNIDKNDAIRRVLLFDMLTENSNKYKTKRDIILKEEELYNSYCGAVTSKLGNEIISSLFIDFLNPKYTKDDYLEEAIKHPFELLFEPNIKDNEFDETTLNSIKTRAISDLQCLNENPSKLAMYNALNIMDENSISSLNLMGSIESINEVTTSNLKETYDNIINHDYIDIFIIGDIDEDKVIDYISKYAKFNTIKNHELSLYVDNKEKKKPIEKVETTNFQQSTIVYIYNMNGLDTKQKKYDAQIYNMILGGGALETKLYRNLRDKNSLCYSVYSMYSKFDNLLYIMTGVDKKNIKKAKKLIEETVEEMSLSITEEEVSKAVSTVVTSLNVSLDSPSRLIDNYYFQTFAELDPIDERIKLYKKVTKEDVLRVSSNIKLNTIYVLEGGNSDEEN